MTEEKAPEWEVIHIPMTTTEMLDKTPGYEIADYISEQFTRSAEKVAASLEGPEVFKLEACAENIAIASVFAHFTGIEKTEDAGKFLIETRSTISSILSLHPRMPILEVAYNQIRIKVLKDFEAFLVKLVEDRGDVR